MGGGFGMVGNGSSKEMKFYILNRIRELKIEMSEIVEKLPKGKITIKEANKRRVEIEAELKKLEIILAK